jgi:hypothetical protein
MNRRILVGALAVAAWVIAGVGLRLGAVAYLLLGVPLMLAFQWKVARRPLWNAWVAGDTPPRLDGRTWALFALAAAVPAWALVAGLLGPGAPSHDAPAWPWAATAVAGAFIAAATIRAQHGAALRRAWPATLGALAAMGLLFTMQALQRHHRLAPARLDMASMRASLASAIVYFDVAFVVEEVAFRGILDPYLLGDERGANAALASAVVSSALWGVWHLPIVFAPGTVQPLPMARIILGHVGIGLLLCLAVRAAGTLVPGAAAHALGDAFRDLVS